MTEEIKKKIKNSLFSFINGIEKIDDFYVYRTPNEYGVALENKSKVLINESFSNLTIRNEALILDDNPLEIILLTTTNRSYIDAFYSFALIFLDKEDREFVINDPLKWWKKWRDLIGNKLYNPSAYDVIAELLTIEKLLIENNKEISWRGPQKSSVDIISDNVQYEVKSSTLRYDNEVTITSQFQLESNEDIGPKYLIYYKLEESENGETINKIMKRLEKYENTINIEEYEEKLMRLGYKMYASIRDKSYVILDVRKYLVDENFPAITKGTFKDNKIPKNIKKITYVINLDNIDYDNWERNR